MGSPGEDPPHHCPAARPTPHGSSVLSINPILFFPLFFLSLPCHMAYVVLAPCPGIEPGPSAVKLQSPHPAHLETLCWMQT